MEGDNIIMYAKIENGELRGAPRPIRTENGDVFTNDPAVLLKNGYKEVVTTEYPSDGKYYLTSWSETDTQIIQVWVETDPPEEIPAEEALSIITGGEET